MRKWNVPETSSSPPPHRVLPTGLYRGVTWSPPATDETWKHCPNGRNATRQQLGLPVERAGRGEWHGEGGQACPPAVWISQEIHYPNFVKAHCNACLDFQNAFIQSGKHLKSCISFSKSLCGGFWFVCILQMLPGWICGPWFGHHKDCFILYGQ